MGRVIAAGEPQQHMDAGGMCAAPPPTRARADTAGGPDKSMSICDDETMLLRFAFWRPRNYVRLRETTIELKEEEVCGVKAEL